MTLYEYKPRADWMNALLLIATILIAIAIVIGTTAKTGSLEDGLAAGALFLMFMLAQIFPAD